MTNLECAQKGTNRQMDGQMAKSNGKGWKVHSVYINSQILYYSGYKC